MCLTIATTPREGCPLPKRVIGYKAFDLYESPNGDLQLYAVHFNHPHEPFLTNLEYLAIRDKPIQCPTGEYERGFHAFLNAKDCINRYSYSGVGIFKVVINDIVAIGSEWDDDDDVLSPVVVGRRMKILRRILIPRRIR